MYQAAWSSPCAVNQRGVSDMRSRPYVMAAL
jgi:hypothetical protein